MLKLKALFLSQHASTSSYRHLADAQPLVDHVDRTERQIQFHNYESASDSVSVPISRLYPVLFAVCREARYEVVRAMNSRWVRIHARSKEPTESSHMAEFKVCIDFKLEKVHLRTHSLAPLLQNSLAASPAPEQQRLESLARRLDIEAAECILHDHITQLSYKTEFRRFF